MSEKTKNAIAVAVAGAMLTGALLFTFDPDLSLRDAILNLIQQPSKIFSYFLPKNQEEPADELLSEGNDTVGELEPNETLPLFFDDVEDDGKNDGAGGPPSPSDPNAPGINQLPADHLD